MKIFFFVSSLLLSCSFGFSSTNTPEDSTCQPPSNLNITSQTDSSISFDWDDCGCDLTAYRIYYVRGGQASSEYPTTCSNITFSGLSAGAYQFHFYTVCSGATSSIIIDEVIVM
jgi:hypothetical protein